MYYLPSKVSPIESPLPHIAFSFSHWVSITLFFSYPTSPYNPILLFHCPNFIKQERNGEVKVWVKIAQLIHVSPPSRPQFFGCCWPPLSSYLPTTSKTSLRKLDFSICKYHVGRNGAFRSGGHCLGDPMCVGKCNLSQDKCKVIPALGTASACYIEVTGRREDLIWSLGSLSSLFSGKRHTLPRQGVIPEHRARSKSWGSCTSWAPTRWHRS